MPKYVATSKTTGMNYLIDTDADELQAELYHLMLQSSAFALRAYHPDTETETLARIWLKDIKCED